MKIFKWKVPFRFVPASWGLTGESYVEAQIRYDEDDPIEAERKIIQRKYRDPLECKKHMVEMEYSNGILSQYEYEKAKLEFITDPQKRKVGTLAFLHKNNEITTDEYNKELCDVFNKPWFKMTWAMNAESGTIDMDIDNNAFFVKYLADIGCPGNTPNEMVDAYARQMARQVLDEEEIDDEGFIRVKESGDGLKTYK